MIWVCTSLFIVFIEALSLTNLASAFLERKVKNKFDRLKFITYIIVTTTILSGDFLSNHFAKTLINIVVCFGFVAMFYEGAYLGKLGIATVSMVIGYCADYITLILVQIGFHIEQEAIMKNIQLFILISFTSKFILYIGTFIIRYVKKDTKPSVSIMVTDWVRILIFPAFSLVTIVVLADVSLKKLANLNLIFFDAIGLIIANIIILNMIRNLEEKSKIKQDNLLLKQRVKLEENNWKTLVDSYSEQRKMTHDFSNHLDTIYSILHAYNVQEVKKYIQSLGENISASSAVVSSNNLIVDAILNQKYNKATSKGITMEFMINDLSNLDITTENIVTILSNALDNAIEAAEKSEEKIIKIKIIKDKSQVAIAVKNTVEKRVTIKNERVESSKKDSISHGYGIKNIKSALANYESIFSITCDKKWFILSIIIQ